MGDKTAIRSLPTVDELISAMEGTYDPHHPHVTILRAAQQLATLPADSSGSALIDEIAAAVGGDEEFALAVDQIALDLMAVHEARGGADSRHVQQTEERLAAARDEYERIVTPTEGKGAR